MSEYIEIDGKGNAKCQKCGEFKQYPFEIDDTIRIVGWICQECNREELDK